MLNLNISTNKTLVVNQLEALTNDLNANYYGLKSDGNVTSANQPSGISDQDRAAMRQFLEMPDTNTNWNIKKVDIARFLARQTQDHLTIKPHTQLSDEKAPILKLVEGDVVKILKQNALNQQSQTLIMPCNVQKSKHSNGPSVGWEHRSGVVLKIITRLLTSADPTLDLRHILGNQKTATNILCSVVSVQLPKNSLHLNHIMLIPLSEFNSTKATIEQQFTAIKENIRETGAHKSQLLLIPPAVSPQYDKNQLVEPAYKLCAENVKSNDFSNGNDLTIVCFAENYDKLKLEKNGLQDGMQLKNTESVSDNSSNEYLAGAASYGSNNYDAACLNKQEGAISNIQQHQKIPNKQPATLRLVEGDVCEILQEDISGQSQILIMPCNVHENGGTHITWENRSGKALNAVTQLLNSLNPKVNLRQHLKNVSLSSQGILSRVASVDLEDNALNLKRVIFIPLSEQCSTQECLAYQYLNVHNLLSKDKNTSGSRLLLIPPAVSPQYRASGLQQSAYELCAQKVAQGNLSRGNDVTVVCFSKSDEKKNLERCGLKDGQQLALADSDKSSSDESSSDESSDDDS